MHNIIYSPGMSTPVSKMSETAMGRLDMMKAQVEDRCTIDQMLCETQANLELLYIKAKNFHWNVKGTGFQGVHEMFDQIQEFASDQGDRIAERMRYYCFPVNATAKNYLECSWFPEGNFDLNQSGMLGDMCMTLTCMIDNLCKYICCMDEYPVDQNIFQDLSEGLGKFCYFVRSNMPELEDKEPTY